MEEDKKRRALFILSQQYSHLQTTKPIFAIINTSHNIFHTKYGILVSGICFECQINWFWLMWCARNMPEKLIRLTITKALPRELSNHLDVWNNCICVDTNKRESLTFIEWDLRIMAWRQLKAENYRINRHKFLWCHHRHYHQGK